jgi:ubiquitin-conjugating enzyme E2 J1
MDTDAKGQLGGIECSKEAREKMARESHAWKCSACAKSNAETMKERQVLVQEIEDKQGKRNEEEIPEDLRLAYRDELDKEAGEGSEADKAQAQAKAVAASSHDTPTAPPSIPAPPSSAANTVTSTSPSSIPRPTRTVQTPTVQQPAPPSPDRSIVLIDTFIYAIVAALLFMVLKKFA